MIAHVASGMGSAPTGGSSEGSVGTVVCRMLEPRQWGCLPLENSKPMGEENLVVRSASPAICDKHSFVRRVNGIDWSQWGKPEGKL